MKKLLAVFKNPWVIAVLGLLAISLLIWFVGPLIAVAGWEPLTSTTSRLVLIVVIVGAWVLNRVRLMLLAKRRNAQMVEGLTEGSAESAEEIATLKQRFEEALSVLKHAKLEQRGGRQYLYQLPWYIIIGPPGSGKTTALVNSGLNFPLADRFGKDAIRGVGGTRNCDWWFTDEAILLDTAGRYTTQDSHQAVDAAAWTGFLDLLKKYRRRRPINGTLIAISIADLMQQTEAERAEHARAIKQRVQELYKHLGIRFPIYVLFTKSDLIAGFVEFFDDLDREGRAQVWGMTLPMDDPKSERGTVDLFAAEFDLLDQQINARLIERMQAERDPRRRDRIFTFPQQFGALKDTAERFLRDVFQPNRFEERALLRGVYFTSGTQEGTPIDRIMTTLAATFGLDRQSLPAFVGTGKSYFITRLFREVVFQEAGLAGTNLRLERQQRWLQQGAYLGAVLATLLAGAAWFTSYTRNQNLVAEVDQQVQTINQLSEALAPEQREVQAALPLLNAVRQLPGGYADRDRGVPWLMGLGLYQGDKLGDEARAAYRRVLDNAFLPRIILRLEQQLRQGGSNSDFLFEALKVYLMLDDPQHFDAAAVQAWMALDWEHNLPRDVTAEQRTQLQEHLSALLEALPQPLPIALDDNLIRQVRATLTRMPLAERVYGRLKRDPVVARLKEFRISDAAGPNAALVLVRRSGKPLNQGIPGLYTYNGYHQVFTTASLAVASQLQGESWILGEEKALSVGPEGLPKLTEAVRKLYLDDYVRQWDDLLADVAIAPFTTMQQAVDILNILSGPDSPLRKLLQAVAQETTLTRAEETKPAEPSGALGRLSAVKDRLAQIIQIGPGTTEAPPQEQPSAVVEQHFAALNNQVRHQGDSPPPLEKTLSLLNEVYVYLNAIANAGDRGGAALEAAKSQASAGGDVIGRLKLEAKREPAPLQNWVETVADGTAALTLGGVKTHLNNIWTSTVVPYYRQGIANRYPLVRGARAEVTLEDFGRFFGPGGLMDDFFQKYLQAFVDTSGRTWTMRSSAAGGLDVSPRVLAEFQRAAVIKETFFRGGGTAPLVRFELKPIAMDANISQFLLSLDEQKVTYSHGPTRPTPMQWPGPNGSTQTQILFSPPAASGPSGVTEDGPWAWFRILDQAAMRPTSLPERFEVSFEVGGRTARFELRASSAFNPFRLNELEQFRCPDKL